MRLTALFPAVLAGILHAVFVQGYGLTAIPKGEQGGIIGPYTQISYYNQSLYVGDVRMYEWTTERFVFYIGAGASRIQFQSWHQTPTGWQNLYIYPNTTRAVGFTMPHSMAIPANATADDFNLGCNGLLQHRHMSRWHACPVPGPKDRIWYQIVWVGVSDNAPAACIPVDLKAESLCS
ncbi:hypothetical protein BDZ91DRAFT_742247 [Kalaharituber pfeilii]|nr:hypothetical protein BDZ91DRAFT_742247 [Kalaharituber pfeilii]